MSELTIKSICEQFRIGQSELARRFGIPIRTVQHWHSGERKPPDYVVRMMRTILENNGKADLQSPIEYDKHYYKCPRCNEDLGVSEDDIYVYGITPPNHCKCCGQALKWPNITIGQLEE